jgi:single-stranded-DNA-specific exonuclease
MQAEIPDSSEVFTSAQKNNISITLSELLITRKITNIKSFLSSKLKDNITFSKIEKLANIEKTINFFNEVKEIKKIGIFSDYDVDGASSAAILKNILTQFDIEVEIHIPNRLTEGYGPNPLAVKKLLENNNHIIFLDCGSNNLEEQKLVKENNSQLLIIDHHECGDAFEDVILINPKYTKDQSVLNDLCTTSLVFLVVFYLTKKEIFYNKDILQYLDLVALATICDLVPLNSINRSFVKQGLKIFNSDNKNKGLMTLINEAKIKQVISEYHLGYVLGPRINAGGRMGESYLGYNLLSSPNIHLAAQYSSVIGGKNQERQKIQTSIINSISDRKEDNQNLINFYYDATWHIGVLGIIAGRLMRTNKRPSFVMTDSDQFIVGSGRSLGGINIGTLMMEAAEKGIIIKGGGHAKACGFTLEKKSWQAFKLFLIDKFTGSEVTQENYYEVSLDLTLINENLLKDLDLLSPFGQNNNEPIFKSENVKFQILNIFKEKHIKCKLSDKLGNSVTGMMFDTNVESFKAYINQKTELDCYYKVKRDTYSSNVIIHIEDIH